jgi:hypothetical protein
MVDVKLTLEGSQGQGSCRKRQAWARLALMA